MKDKFERLREKLNRSIEENGLDSEKTQKISREFDELLNSYYKKEKMYSEKSIIYQEYQKSINELEKITKEFGEFPSVEEWNKYAKEKNLLTSESLKYVSGLNWKDLKNLMLFGKK